MIETIAQQKSMYFENLKNPKWFEKRKEVIARDKNCCQNCGSTEKLRVHHKQYHIYKKGNIFQKPWKYKNDKLITLCSECHKIGHKKFKVPVFLI